MQAKQQPDRQENQSIQASEAMPSSSSANNETTGGFADVLEKVLSNKDIWVHKILPFVGPGHFLYLALVCKLFKQCYQHFFATLPPFQVQFLGVPRQAMAPDTYLSAAFSSVSRAEYYWNKTNNQLPFEWICGEIAEHGTLEVLQWARGEGFPWDIDEIECFCAVKRGNLEMLQYLHANGCPSGDTDCATAANLGHVEILQFLHEKGFPWTEKTCQFAAMKGHLKCLKYAHEQGLWDPETTRTAAENGHLEILKYAHEKGCPWHPEMCMLAAFYGHLECLQCAHQKGCCWDQLNSGFTAANGHLECLQYAWANGCPFDEEHVRRVAEQYNHQNILNWLDELVGEEAA